MLKIMLFFVIVEMVTSEFYGFGFIDQIWFLLLNFYIISRLARRTMLRIVLFFVIVELGHLRT